MLDPIDDRPSSERRKAGAITRLFLTRLRAPLVLTSVLVHAYARMVL